MRIRIARAGCLPEQMSWPSLQVFQQATLIYKIKEAVVVFTAIWLSETSILKSFIDRAHERMLCIVYLFVWTGLANGIC